MGRPAGRPMGCSPHTMEYNPPSSSLLPLAVSQGEIVSVHAARDRYPACHRQHLIKVLLTNVFSPPPVPPTMLVASWSMSSLPPFPRWLNLSAARVTKQWLLSPPVLNERSVALSRLRNVSSSSVSICAASPHVNPCLGVCMRNVEEHRLVAVL